MKHIVFGASGLLGSELFKSLKKQNKSIYGTFFKNKLFDELKYFNILKDKVLDKFDITDEDSCYVFSSKIDPNWIFKNKEESNLINIIALKKIIDEIVTTGAKIVFFSTEIVFDGKVGGYRESDEPKPTTLYAKQKLEIEEYIKLKSNNYLILRTGATLAWEKEQNCPIVKTYESLLQNDAKMIEDNLLTITDVHDTISILNNLIQRKMTNEIFHIVSNPPILRTRIADMIISNSKNKSIKDYNVVSLESIKYLEERPLKSWLDNSKVKSLLSCDFNIPEDIILKKIELIDEWCHNE